MELKSLFFDLLEADTEDKVHGILKSRDLLDSKEHWQPYGNTESNYAVVENQQSHPVPALVEKVTNGIDAILERRCLENGIDPKSAEAPRSVDDALVKFFPNHSNWDLSGELRKQASELQIVADGPRNDTSLLVYDNGVGQRPEDFPDTFLSLLRGNKNDVHFVQGKYNMGGAGAIAFCGDKRYQLIASKKFKGSDLMGFTLIRRHPLSKEESFQRKSTWYEYLCFDSKVPSFKSISFDAGLDQRDFETGSLVKLYSYRLPPGVRSIISRDLNLSLNEFLFKPALPFLTVDNNKRFPNNKVPVNPVYGLKKLLDGENNFVEHTFSLVPNLPKFGKLYITVYVFNVRAQDKDVKYTKEYIRREYFKNNMSVMFSLNGQVQGHYTSEFITRSLKMALLKDYLLIHVDCSELHTEMRNELFMASRDRLKTGEIESELRKELTKILSKSILRDIEKTRRANLNVGSESAEKMLQDIAKNIPINQTLTKLFHQSIQIPNIERNKRKKPKRINGKPNESKPFNPKRFPSTFQIGRGDGEHEGLPFFKVPEDGTKDINFSTDVENEYFDRSDEPGDLEIRVMRQKSENTNSTDSAGSSSKEIDEKLDIVRTSPNQGKIRINLGPTSKADVGDRFKIDTKLTSPSGDFEQQFFAEICNPDKSSNSPKSKNDQFTGLPKLVTCTENGRDDTSSWYEIENSGIMVDYSTILRLVTDEEGTRLSKIIINMDSTVFMDYRKNQKTSEAIQIASNRYISSIYLHSIFLFASAKSGSYTMNQTVKNNEVNAVELEEFISDIFSTTYAQFLLNFEVSDILDTIA